MVRATCLLFGLLLFLTSTSVDAANKTLSSYNSFINVTTSFTLNDSLSQFPSFTDGSRVRPILISKATSDNTIKFGCGFYCRGGNCTHYLFSVFILVHDKHLQPLVYAPPQVVWSANPNHPVTEGAMLVPDAQNGWILQDVDKTLVWNTPKVKSISLLVLKDSGNLVLYNADHSPIWESFSYPSDSLLPGQNLTQGTANKLIPVSRFTDRKIPYNSYYLQVTKKGVFTYVDSNPPTLYYSYLVKPNKKPVKDEPPLSYIRFFNGSLSCFILSTEPNEPDFAFSIPRASSVQYLKLMPDGRLIAREWNLHKWTQVSDILMSPRGKCGQPMACGKNSVCSASQQCDCVGSQYFRPNNYLQNNLGCYSLTPLLCNDTKAQILISEKNVQHLIFTTHMEGVDMLTCKQACLHKCPCKAAVFRHGSDSSNGSCYLPTELYTLLKVDPVEINHKDETFIKIQITPVFHWRFAERSHPRRQRLPVIIVIAICLGGFVVLGVFAFLFSFFKYLKEKRNNKQLYQELEKYDDDMYIKNVPGLPTWYSYQLLQTATNDFSEKNLIGRGGQASCFRGTLDDSEIAVKKFVERVDFNESFKSEIKAIASLHHVNVLKLVGYCPFVDSPLLVYEYMVNGSLDKWIRRDAKELTWSTWKRIITQIAKGLTYLNEECNSQGILHFDVKPENVLLDADFNVKICDFGLSRFISTSQRQNTSERVHHDILKGTMGYIAPERAHGQIKTTTDVYSFGMIVLEISGRERTHDKLDLRSKLGKFIMTGNTDDLIGKKHENHKEAGEMLKLAAWCLEFQHEKRPRMSDVCKVLDGRMSVPTDLSSIYATSTSEASTSGTKPVKASFKIEQEM